MIRWFLRLFPYVRDLERCRDDFSEYITGNVTFREIAIRNGMVSMKVGTELASVFAANMLAIMDELGAKNFVEMKLIDNGRQVLLTLQRAEGKTPADLLNEAKARIDELEATGLPGRLPS